MSKWVRPTVEGEEEQDGRRNGGTRRWRPCSFRVLRQLSPVPPQQPLTRCVDSVCLCPRPHVLTPDARCSAPPRGSGDDPGVLNVLIATAPTAALVLTLVALGALYGCHRWKQRAQQRSSSSSSLTHAAECPGHELSPPQQPTSASFVHPASRVNRRFLRNFLACHEYNRARRLGLPLPQEGERPPPTTTVCLFREYTTVSSITTLESDKSGERSERAALQRRWTSATRSDGDPQLLMRPRPLLHQQASLNVSPG
ncbi:hypothetical protein HPB51_005276 [Rhipicephalus microplus]|uniref:Uncharacterized protein n=1 Tax=Rhipicephalus microplus TaxID=6941 RepID=A0A9J6DFT2_RHIMP|nr:hypothetical protein HPB51_005276 [Rhipicephalus microplus]